MKRIGFLLILLLGMVFTSCMDESSVISIEEPLTNAPPGGGGGEEDDETLPPPPPPSD